MRATVQGSKAASLPGHPLNLYLFLSFHAGLWWAQRGAESFSDAGLQSHPKEYQENGKIRQVTCCQSGISSEKRWLTGLGKNWEIGEQGESWGISGGGGHLV